MTRTIEIPFLSLVTAADTDWQRDNRLIQQDTRRPNKVDWRSRAPYDYSLAPPPGYVFVVDENGAYCRDGDFFLITPE